MGNFQQKYLQKAKDLDYEQLRQQSSFEGEIVEDFRYGSGLIIYNQTLQMQFLLQTQTYTLLSQYNQVCDEAQKRLVLDVPSILQLLKYNGAEFMNQFGKSFKVSFLFEFHQLTLQDEISRRTETQQPYGEQDLYQIIDHVISGLLVFKSKGMKHSFIQPSSIFKQNDPTIYKINDISFMSGQSEYKRFLNGVKDSCYLSPKLFEELGQRVEIPVHEQEKSELNFSKKVFSLGRTLLELILLKNVSDEIYDFNTFRVNDQFLIECLDSLQSSYKIQFIQLLGGMLDLNEDTRIGYDGIISIVQKQLQETKQESLSQYIQQQINGRSSKTIQQPKSRQFSPLSYKQTTQLNDLDNLFPSPPVYNQGTFGREDQSQKSSWPYISDFQDRTPKRSEKNPIYDSNRTSKRPPSYGPSQPIIPRNTKSVMLPPFPQPTRATSPIGNQMRCSGHSPMPKIQGPHSQQFVDSNPMNSPKHQPMSSSGFIRSEQNISQTQVKGQVTSPVEKKTSPTNKRQGSQVKGTVTSPLEKPIQRTDSIKEEPSQRFEEPKGHFVPVKTKTMDFQKSRIDHPMAKSATNQYENENDSRINPVSFRSPISKSQYQRNDTSDIPKSPLQKLKERKVQNQNFNIKSNVVSPSPSTVTFNKHEDQDFNQQFSNLQHRLDKLSPDVLSRQGITSQRSSPKRNLMVASLPQSDIIYMHSGNSLFINEIFQKDSKRNNHYEEVRRDFWL